MGIKHTLLGKEVELNLPLKTGDWKRLKQESNIRLRDLADPDVDVMSAVAQLVLDKSKIEVKADEDLTLHELAELMKVIAAAETGPVDRPI